MQQLQANKGILQFQLVLRTALGLILACAGMSSATQAYACAACGCTLSTNWASQGVNTTPGFTADLSYSYVNQNTLVYGSGKASSAQINTLFAAGQEIETSTLTQTITATLNYNSDTWGATFQVPYLSRTHGTDGVYGQPASNTTLGSGYTTSSDSGIGDIRIIGRYTGFSPARTSGLIAGVKLPTGSTGASFTGGASAGFALDPGLQLGTGSTDIILGAYTSGLISKYGWFVQGTAQRAIKTANDMLGNPYRPGDTYSLNTGIRYAGFGAKVSPMLQLNIVRRQADTGLDIPNDALNPTVPVSGGTLAYLAPGVTVRVGGGTSVYGFIQLPVYQNVNSLQLVPQYTLTFGVHQTF